LLLIAGGPELERRAVEVLACFAGRPHVFNLGHGIGQTTPIDHVARLLAVVRGWNP
jgi:uroporphyrinogen decarboxylase